MGAMLELIQQSPALTRYTLSCATGFDREPCRFGPTQLSEQIHHAKTACSGHTVLLVRCVCFVRVLPEPLAQRGWFMPHQQAVLVRTLLSKTALCNPSVVRL